MDQTGACRESRDSCGAETLGRGGDWLVQAAYWMFGSTLVFAILSSRCLYADGSNWFVQALSNGSFMEPFPGRVFPTYLIQLPLAISLKLGVTDLTVLRLLFGFGCFLPWPVVMVVCQRLSPSHSWLVTLACAAGYLNACFMAVGEHIVAHAFFWPPVFVLLFVRPLTPFAAGALLASATILLNSYESLVFLGPPLAVGALTRGIGGGENGWRRYTLLLATALFLAATLIAFENVRHTPVPGNYSGFKAGVRRELFYPCWTVAWSVSWLFLMLTMSLPPALSRRVPHRHLYAVLGCAFAPVVWNAGWLVLPRFLLVVVALFLAALCVLPEFTALLRSRIGRGMLGCALVIWGIGPWLWPAHLDPGRQYYSRFLNLAVPLGLLPIAAIAAWKPRWVEPQRRTLIGLSAAFLMAQSLWHFAATWQWQGYVALWRVVQASHVGPVKITDTPLAGRVRGGQSLRFDWWWTDPSLSIALSSPGEVTSLIVPTSRPKYQPFDPFNPSELPALDRYGLDFRRYVSALSDPATNAPAKSASPP